MSWRKFAAGESIGKVGSENGTIVEDDELYAGPGARITLERSTRYGPFAITCGVYGWMVHTRFLGQEVEARVQFDAMKAALEEIASNIELVQSLPFAEMLSRISPLLQDFVERFPT
jgi:hypothetical protein